MTITVLLPLQGVVSDCLHTQGAALGYKLLPFQGDPLLCESRGNYILCAPCRLVHPPPRGGLGWGFRVGLWAGALAIYHRKVAREDSYYEAAYDLSEGVEPQQHTPCAHYAGQYEERAEPPEGIEGEEVRARISSSENR